MLFSRLTALPPIRTATANDRAGKPDVDGRCHIMQLRQDADGRDLDPRDLANWTVPEPILGPGERILNLVQRIRST